jgi:hypothetical protein
MASKINKEAGAVKKGTSDKVGAINYSVTGFLLGYLVAFYWGWKFSLILCAALPFLGCSGVGWAMTLHTGAVEQMKAYAQSAGYAEQAL